MSQLSGFRVAVLATDGFEDSELTEPVQALRQAGAHVDVIAPQAGKIQGFHHHDKSITVSVDRTLNEADPASYDALLLPGGALNADALRVAPGVPAFIRAMDTAGKPIAAICHAPWELISASIIRGRTLTSFPTIEDDIRNAGGHWVDREVMIDRNLITSRRPEDIPAFNLEMIRVFACLAQPAPR